MELLGSLMLFYFLGVIFFVLSSNYKRDYLKRIETEKSEKFISVIIPAKDEEKNIAKTLADVLEQNYPVDSYEVILVNDRSEDKTKEIAESFQEKYKQLKVLTLTEKSETLSGKQNALDKGIKFASGEIILITDADCIVGKNWVRSMAKFFADEDTGIVVGKTEILIEGKGKLIDKFQSMVHRMLMDIAQVPIIFGFYTSGMGNNMAFKKSIYLELGGYEGLGNSILDDEILVRGIAQKGYKVAAAFSRNSVVDTHPMPTWGKVLKQHKRWIVGGLNLFTPTGWSIYALYFINILTILLILTGNGLWAFWKFAADYILFIKLNRSDDDKKINILEEIIMGFFTTIYLSVVGTMAITNPKVSWKNEKLKNTRI